MVVKYASAKEHMEKLRVQGKHMGNAGNFIFIRMSQPC